MRACACVPGARVPMGAFPLFLGWFPTLLLLYSLDGAAVFNVAGALICRFPFRAAARRSGRSLTSHFRKETAPRSMTRTPIPCLGPILAMPNLIEAYAPVEEAHQPTSSARSRPPLPLPQQ